MQNCHPNYVEFLLNKKTLTITDVNTILSGIPNDIKLLYNKEYIENAYTEYQSKAIDDKNDLKELGKEFIDRSILLLGPGSSVSKESSKINEFIRQNNPIVVSVNFNPDEFYSDFIFLSNAKRYIALLDTDLSSAKLILTSNVSDYAKKAGYVLNYSSSIRDDIGRNDNALLLLLSNLCRIGVRKVFLAGFDGYKENAQNYSDPSYNFVGNEEYKISNNTIIAKSLRKLGEEINIEFITETLYR